MPKEAISYAQRGNLSARTVRNAAADTRAREKAINKTSGGTGLAQGDPAITGEPCPAVPGLSMRFSRVDWPLSLNHSINVDASQTTVGHTSRGDGVNAPCSACLLAQVLRIKRVMRTYLDDLCNNTIFF